MTTEKREITTDELESIQHEAFVLGQATGMLMKYGYKDLAVQLYNTATKIFDDKRKEGDDAGKKG